jgi:hypothetical protein
MHFFKLLIFCDVSRWLPHRDVDGGRVLFSDYSRNSNVAASLASNLRSAVFAELRHLSRSQPPPFGAELRWRQGRQSFDLSRQL